ncbi:MAG: hypothetical protein ACM3X0_15710 [Bacteroidota bacterium]
MLSDSPVLTVHIPPPLRSYAGGRAEIMASGDTVGEVFETISHEYPAIRSLLVRDGRLAPGLAVFLGPRSVRELQGLATPVDQEELISVVLTGEVPG